MPGTVLRALKNISNRMVMKIRQNSWNAAKAVLTEKFIALKAYFCKEIKV